MRACDSFLFTLITLKSSDIDLILWYYCWKLQTLGRITTRPDWSSVVFFVGKSENLLFVGMKKCIKRPMSSSILCYIHTACANNLYTFICWNTYEPLCNHVINLQFYNCSQHPCRFQLNYDSKGLYNINHWINHLSHLNWHTVWFNPRFFTISTTVPFFILISQTSVHSSFNSNLNTF